MATPRTRCYRRWARVRAKAIDDGVALAAKLLEAGDLEASESVAKALRRYESERTPPTSAIVNESWDLAKTYHWRNPIACWVRDTGFRLVPNTIWRRRSTSGLV